MVKNGVDFDLFEPFSKKKVGTTVPKKVGYTGSLDFRFDVDLIEYAVQKLPKISFEFTGAVSNPLVLERLESYKNVVFSPAVHASKVPEVVSAFDVGIIPYVCSEINKNIYPLKINEYLAIGIPVVMTEFAQLDDFNGIVNVVDSKEEFVACIEREIAVDSDKRIAERVAFAKANSWNDRAQQFGSLLEDLCYTYQLAPY